VQAVPEPSAQLVPLAGVEKGPELRAACRVGIIGYPGFDNFDQVVVGRSGLDR
jgi:hypothetical protein